MSSILIAKRHTSAIDNRVVLLNSIMHVCSVELHIHKKYADVLNGIDHVTIQVKIPSVSMKTRICGICSIYGYAYR